MEHWFTVLLNHIYYPSSLQGRATHDQYIHRRTQLERKHILHPGSTSNGIPKSRNGRIRLKKKAINYRKSNRQYRAMAALLWPS